MALVSKGKEMIEFTVICGLSVVLLMSYFIAMVVVLKTHFKITWREIIVEIAFKRSAGTYLFYVTAIYFFVAMYAVFVEPTFRLEYVQVAWLVVCSLPLWIPPLAKFLRMKTVWQ